MQANRILTPAEQRNKITGGALRHAAHKLYLQNAVRFHSTRVNVISIAPHNTSTAFRQPVFMKLTHCQQHYVQISYTEFHPNLLVNVGSTDRQTFTDAPNKVC